MPVPSSNSHLKKATGGAYVKTDEVINGGKVLGHSDFTILDSRDDNADISTMIGALSGSAHTYSAAKALSSGTFGYDNQAGVHMQRTVSLSGVANTKLQNGAADHGNRLNVMKYRKTIGANTASKVRLGLFNYTGRFADGSSIGSRTLFVNAANTAVSDPTALNSFLYDIADGNNSDIQLDDAVGTRVKPGEYTVLTNFVSFTANNLDIEGVMGA
jgi:hypothetical protein